MLNVTLSLKLLLRVKLIQKNPYSILLLQYHKGPVGNLARCSCPYVSPTFSPDGLRCLSGPAPAAAQSLELSQLFVLATFPGPAEAVR